MILPLDNLPKFVQLKIIHFTFNFSEIQFWEDSLKPVIGKIYSCILSQCYGDNL